ncbi:MAG: SIS domain-containing protein, partial [Bacteroidota bacterium]
MAPHAPSPDSREQFIRDSLNESSAIKRRIAEQCMPQISQAVDLLADALRNNRKILLCGNGGS